MSATRAALSSSEHRFYCGAPWHPAENAALATREANWLLARTEPRRHNTTHAPLYSIAIGRRLGSVRMAIELECGKAMVEALADVLPILGEMEQEAGR